MTSVDSRTRNIARITLGATILITIGTWFFIDAATKRGLARLQRMDAVWAVCKRSYDSARTVGDTSRIDARPLSAAVDSGKRDAPQRCGDMRRPEALQQARDSANRAATAREMMPSKPPR